MDLPSMRALAYAASLGQAGPGPAHQSSRRGGRALSALLAPVGEHLPLEVVVSPHRAIVAPIVNYVESLHRERPELTLTVILPEIVVRHWLAPSSFITTRPRDCAEHCVRCRRSSSLRSPLLGALARAQVNTPTVMPGGAPAAGLPRDCGRAARSRWTPRVAPHSSHGNPTLVARSTT